jgi:hypothetical protein
MCEKLGVYPDAILSVGIQTVWDLNKRQRGVLLGIEEFRDRIWATEHIIRGSHGVNMIAPARQY